MEKQPTEERCSPLLPPKAEERKNPDAQLLSTAKTNERAFVKPARSINL